jgi:ABC-type multidrug transport system ATPase subunit
MGFFVNFNIDENFNEVIKSRYRDEFAYSSFSEGEKTRIDLALMFTWRAVAKMKNSVNTNLLILDEILDGSLDANGTDEFLKIIKTLTDDTNTYIISHKQDQLIDKFDKVYRFEKQKNFSRMI